MGGSAYAHDITVSVPFLLITSSTSLYRAKVSSSRSNHLSSSCWSSSSVAFMNSSPGFQANMSLYSDQVIFDTNPATMSQTLMTISSFESTYSARRIPKDSSGYWPSIPSMISLVLDGLIPRERRCDVNHWNDFS